MAGKAGGDWQIKVPFHFAAETAGMLSSHSVGGQAVCIAAGYRLSPELQQELNLELTLTEVSLLHILPATKDRQIDRQINKLYGE